MPQHCYYDTGLFLYFFFTKEEITKSHEYFYKKTNFEKYTSFFVMEEFLQLAQRGEVQIKYGNEETYKTFADVWDSLDTFHGYFKKERAHWTPDSKETPTPTLKEIQTDLYKYMNIIRLLNIDLIEERKKREAFDFMDWVHLIIADNLGCNEFLTVDTHFKILRKFSEHQEFKFKSLERIIPFEFNKTTLELNQMDDKDIVYLG